MKHRPVRYSFFGKPVRLNYNRFQFFCSLKSVSATAVTVENYTEVTIITRHLQVAFSPLEVTAVIVTVPDFFPVTLP